MAETKLSIVPRVRLGVQVYERLKERILDGSWSPGTKIPSENELTQQLGVSRIVVRESLQKLIALGLLESRQGEGTFVKKVTADTYMNPLFPLLVLDPSDIMDVLEYRLIVEPPTARIACERRTDRDLEHLDAAITDMEGHRDDAASFTRSDLAFHLLIAEASHNPVMTKTFAVIKDVMGTAMADLLTAEGVKAAVAEHREMIVSIRDQDAARAHDLLRAHVSKTIGRFSRRGIS